MITTYRNRQLLLWGLVDLFMIHIPRARTHTVVNIEIIRDGLAFLSRKRQKKNKISILKFNEDCYLLFCSEIKRGWCMYVGGI